MIRPPTSMIMMRSESMETAMHQEMMWDSDAGVVTAYDADQAMVADVK